MKQPPRCYKNQKPMNPLALLFQSTLLLGKYGHVGRSAVVAQPRLSRRGVPSRRAIGAFGAALVARKPLGPQRWAPAPRWKGASTRARVEPAQLQGFVETSKCLLYSWRALCGERPSTALEGRVCWKGFVYPRQRLLLTQGTSALARRRRSGCYNVAMVIPII